MIDVARAVREYAPTSAGVAAPWRSTDVNPFLSALGDYDATRAIKQVTPRCFYAYTGDAINFRYLFVPESALRNTPGCLWASLVPSRVDTEEAASPTLEEVPVVCSPVPNSALQAIAEWSRLSVEELAELFHSSRRSIYNWLEGKSIGRDVASHIASTYDALLPLKGSRDAYFFRAWLMRGTPSPYELIRNEQWQQLAGLVEREILPLAAIDQTALESGAQSQEEPLGHDVLRTMMSALASTTPIIQSSKVDWQPQELTGLGSSMEDIEDDV